MKIEFEIIKEDNKPRLWIVEAPFGAERIKDSDINLFTSGNPTCYFNLPLGDGTVLRIPYPC
jgi:hypothetical protein